MVIVLQPQKPAIMGAGLPRSWKSHEKSGILKITGISGKVMELSSGSWHLEFSAKCREKVMEFDKRVIHLSKTAQVGKNFVRPQVKRCEIRITEAFYLFACTGP